MTRQEELVQAARKEYPEWEEAQCHFIDGAHYADSHPHWISVEDELPPIFPLNPNESMNVITYGLHTMVNWYDYERGKWVRDSEITHWMPLPQPPVLSNSENTGKDLKGGEE